ncbi:hypothetical protein BIU87_07635 [Streptomyces sp. ZS0098]|nr:hypothetical protein BIU87_07635 [Streptomyces sp. ZS0098]
MRTTPPDAGHRLSVRVGLVRPIGDSRGAFSSWPSPAWSIPPLVPVLPGLLACAATVVDLRRPDGAPPAG